MKIVIPMLGRGSKFLQAGFTTPKLLIDVNGKALYEWALDPIEELDLEKNATFIIYKDHVKQWGLDNRIRKIVGKKAHIDIVDFIPQGALKSVLLVRSHIENDPLLIYNADQFFISDIKKIKKIMNSGVDGLILYFLSTHPKWSYITADTNGIVTRIAEKEIISNKATVGFYYFKNGQDFVWAADRILEKKIMIAGEYYVAPTYNELIAKGKKIKSEKIDEMWGLGSPDDVSRFEKYYAPLHRKNKK